IVAESTTLRRHLQFLHQGPYYKWCKQNDFESQLPDDVAERKAAAAASEAKKSGQSTQPPITDHLTEDPQLLPFTNALFQQAAIEWLIATDQPISALEHPRFQEMIAIAARATRGVRIPNRHVTRQHIIDLFKKNLSDLRKRLLVRVSMHFKCPY
ncbi:hypothetical protein DFP72DRAFT_824235, partial [Ephemerocybe angulata]